MVWTDLCNNILPRSKAKATEQALARKAKKGWINEDAQEFSRNLRGKPEALKQNAWDTERVIACQVQSNQEQSCQLQNL